MVSSISHLGCYEHFFHVSVKEQLTSVEEQSDSCHGETDGANHPGNEREFPAAEADEPDTTDTGGNEHHHHHYTSVLGRGRGCM